MNAVGSSDSFCRKLYGSWWINSVEFLSSGWCWKYVWTDCRIRAVLQASLLWSENCNPSSGTQKNIIHGIYQVYTCLYHVYTKYIPCIYHVYSAFIMHILYTKKGYVHVLHIIVHILLHILHIIAHIVHIIVHILYKEKEYVHFFILLCILFCILCISLYILCLLISIFWVVFAVLVFPLGQHQGCSTPWTWAFSALASHWQGL